MKSSKFFKVLKFVLKYVVPVVLSYIEGDTHAAADVIGSVL